MWWSQKQFPVTACHLNTFHHKIILLLLHHSLVLNLGTNIKMEQNNNTPPSHSLKPQAQIHHESDTQSRQTAPSQCMTAVGSAGSCLPLQRPVTPWRYSPNRPQFMLRGWERICQRKTHSASSEADPKTTPSAVPSGSQVTNTMGSLLGPSGLLFPTVCVNGIVYPRCY